MSRDWIAIGAGLMTLVCATGLAVAEGPWEIGASIVGTVLFFGVFFAAVENDDA